MHEKARICRTFLYFRYHVAVDDDHPNDSAKTPFERMGDRVFDSYSTTLSLATVLVCTEF
jgi:hypothetical protein